MTCVFRRHDVSRDEVTVIPEVVPPDPNPVASLMTATKVELPGYCNGKDRLVPEVMV